MAFEGDFDYYDFFDHIDPYYDDIGGFGDVEDAMGADLWPDDQSLDEVAAESDEDAKLLWSEDEYKRIWGEKARAEELASRKGCFPF